MADPTDDIATECQLAVIFLNECLSQFGMNHVQHIIERNTPSMIAERRQDLPKQKESALSLTPDEREALRDVLATQRRRTFITMGLLGSAGLGDGLLLSQKKELNSASVIMGGLFSLTAFKGALMLMVDTPNPDPIVKELLTGGSNAATPEAHAAAVAFLRSFNNELQKTSATISRSRDERMM